MNDGSTDGAESVLDPFHDPDGSEVCPFVFIISRSSDCPPDVNGRLNTPREIGWPSRT